MKGQKVVSAKLGIQYGLNLWCRTVRYAACQQIQHECISTTLHINNYYYYNRFTALWILSGTTRVSWYQKGKFKTNLAFLEQETVSGSGISWTICKSAPRPRQLCQAGYSSCRTTNSVKALKAFTYQQCLQHCASFVTCLLASVCLSFFPFFSFIVQTSIGLCLK